MPQAKRKAKRKYKMTVAGQLVKHLGLQMYSGAVPAIAELISNAYDAMARNVWIEIPLDRALDQDQDVISVKDDGHGMTYNECNQLYLNVGLERRKRAGDWTKKCGDLKPRKVQGRKGIGKLSGFGIAERIEIRSIRGHGISHFAMNYSDLTRAESFLSEEGYEPETLVDDAKITKKPPETHVKLAQLKITRAIPKGQFMTSLARRLLVLDHNFTVHINGEPVTRDEIPFQFRFPSGPGQWQRATLENGQEVRWWAGFCKETIRDDQQRGFVVYVRGKLAQEPWFFDLSGGVWGQHGMQYMTGEIRADFLDESVDLISTDRGTVRWEDPIAVPLLKWGKKKVKDLLEKWSEKRTAAKKKSPVVVKYLALSESLPQRERTVFKNVVSRVTSIPQIDKDKEGRDLVDDLVEFIYNALTNRRFLEVIRQVNAASPDDRAKFDEVLSEWDIIEAISTAHLVKGRVEIIKKFRDMLKRRVPEKPDMQEYLKKHPWLIDPKWTLLAHEKGLDTLLLKHFDIEKGNDKEGGRRVDFFCLGDSRSVAHVVELKHPGKVVGRTELRQNEDYVDYLRECLITASLDPKKKRTSISGIFICREIRNEDVEFANGLRNLGKVTAWTYDDLLRTTLQMHRDFLRVVKDRAPEGDPRIAELDDIEGSMADLPRGKRGKRKKRAGRKTNK